MARLTLSSATLFGSRKTKFYTNKRFGELFGNYVENLGAP